MAQEGVYVFPDAASHTASSSIDPGLLALLNQNGGFGGNGNWIWILFLWMMWGSNGNFNNGIGNNGTGFISNQLNNNQGRDLLLQALNGRADALGQISQITNTGVETVKNGIFALQNAINQVGNQVGMSGLQTINALQLGNANLSQQLCECCCNMRYDLANQTNTLQAQAAQNYANSQLQSAQNHAATQLQMAQIESADQLAVCQQTNALSTQADRNANSILGAIQAQNAMITDQFCQLKERELQSKIDTQGDIITQLRGQISNDKQTEAFNRAFNTLNDKINTMAAKQPNTVPVTYPNLVAANATPFVGQGYYSGYGGWGNGGVVL
jgi:hypothetical protein